MTYDLSTSETYSQIDKSKLPIITPEILNSYSPPEGLPELRLKIAELEGTDSSHILIGPGSKFIFRSLISTEGDLLIITPNWPGYETAATSSNVKIHLFDTLKTNLKPNLNKLEEYLDNNNQIKFLVISTPNNPTGIIYTEEEIKQIYSICEKHKILFIVDQIYSSVNFGKQSIFDSTSMINNPNKYKYLVKLNSSTKMFGLQGLRIGWLVTKDQTLIEHISEDIRSSIICTPAVTQSIFLNILNSEAYNTNLEKLIKNRNTILQSINSSKNLSVEHIPEAGSTFLVKVPEGVNTQVLSERILADKSIEVMPGEKVYAPGYIRIAFSLPKDLDLSKIITKIDKYITILINNDQN